MKNYFIFACISLKKSIFKSTQKHPTFLAFSAQHGWTTRPNNIAHELYTFEALPKEKKKQRKEKNYTFEGYDGHSSMVNS